MNKSLTLQLIALFIITQAVGLYVANSLISTPGFEPPPIVNDNPNDPINTAGLIIYILSFTAVLLIVIKFFRKKSYYFLKAFELVAVFGASSIVFSIFFGDLAALMLAGILVSLRIAIPKNISVRNFAALCAIIGAGALLGVSLGVIPVALFVAALSAYDFIAVFKTKHMVSIAKAVTSKNLAFTIALPTKEHKFELGTGDLVIPLVFASAVLQNSGIWIAVLVLAGSLTGLLLTIDYSSKHVGKALPALPLQGIFMILFFAIAKVFEF